MNLQLASPSPQFDIKGLQPTVRNGDAYGVVLELVYWQQWKILTESIADINSAKSVLNFGTENE